MTSILDKTGQRFGRLTVVGYAGTRSRMSLWKCVCDCGGESFVTSGNWGQTKSCGCLSAGKGFKRSPGESARMHILRSYKSGAKRRSLVWGLTDEDFSKLTGMDCFYCGSPPSKTMQTGKTNGEFVWNGIDRIDNGGGYVRGNVITCCWKCNRAKGQISYQEFAEWISDLADHQIKVWEAWEKAQEANLFDEGDTGSE